MADNRNLFQKVVDQVIMGDYAQFNRPNPAPSSTPDYRQQVNNMTAQNNANDKANADALAAARASLAAANAQLAAQPKLKSYDTAAAWANAQKQAETRWNPVYQEKLNKFLQEQANKQARLQEENTRTKQDLETVLAQTLQDNSADRTRTAEDVASKIGETNYQEGKFQQVEGDAFDQAVRTLRGQVADAGLTTSGIGQQQEQAATTERNITSKDQLRTFENQRETQRIFQTRKFEDLDKVDTRTQQKTEIDKQRADKDLADYINDLNLKTEVYKADNEVERISKVNESTGGAYDALLQQFIASLIGSGARAQDIALTQQVYGRR